MQIQQCKTFLQDLSIMDENIMAELVHIITNSYDAAKDFPD